MVGLSSTNADDINRKLIKFLPVLDSPYGRYPIKFPRWLDPKEKDEKGRPCFIKAMQDAGPKPDYVWGRGKFGFGYYHLMCKDAYGNLYSEITQNPPAGCCSCFNKSARHEMDEWDDVKRIIYSRKVATKPDDGVAAQDAISESRATAKVWHNALQNEQLVVGTVGATSLARAL